MNDELQITGASTSIIVDVNGVKIHCHDGGEERPVGLIHGGGPGSSGWSSYSKNILDFSKYYRVITPDFPECGQSNVKPLDVPVPGWLVGDQNGSGSRCA